MKQLIGIIYLLIPWRLEFYIFHLFYIGLLQTMNNNLQRLERLVFYIYANLVNNRMIFQAPGFPLPQVHNPYPYPPEGITNKENSKESSC